jgi:hypothetical protein
MATPNFELAFARLADFSERELENYLCHHGPRRFDRHILRVMVAAVERPEYPTRHDVYLALAVYLYRAGHTRTVVQVLQWEGFVPVPSERDMTWALDFVEPRWWTAYEWTLGGRLPTFRGRRIMNGQPL